MNAGQLTAAQILREFPGIESFTRCPGAVGTIAGATTKHG